MPMRALLLAALLVSVTVIAIAPAIDVRPPGGGCQVQEEYVTGAHTSGNLRDGSLTLEPGARGPIECYY